METISRSFTIHTITIKDALTGEVKTREVDGVKIPMVEVTTKTPNRKAIAVKTVKELGEPNFIIDITSVTEKREMPLDTFIGNSQVVAVSNDGGETWTDVKIAEI